MSIYERLVNNSYLTLQEIKSHRYVQHNDEIAKLFFEEGELKEFKKDELLIEQGNTDQDIYLILSGESSIIIHGNKLPQKRRKGDTVGEMTIINPTEPRIATIKAEMDTTTLKLSFEAFNRILEKNPSVYLRVLKEITEKFQERNAQIKKANSTPKLFIISSAESLEVANSIYDNLYRNIDIEIWSDSNAFSPTSNTLFELEEKIKNVDFALAILSPDDDLRFRKQDFKSPRDNVILELGMAIGSIGRKRAFFTIPTNTKIKIPSDLNGITSLSYFIRADSIDTRSTANTLRQVFNELGVRSCFE
ncbi:nucleotide-binding protein [Acinetobacter nosocomialis]|uniref:TIR domain-containing protein n=1 Tax=Acinetobacter nosocomialis TaxID=106654 RepID=UPI0026F00DF3|nr:TIR domain-containing protein [Acinetobacter nosocomialis]MDO7206854.1 nucleotide-binding protein [Acinetobacter nosocomialis]